MIIFDIGDNMARTKKRQEVEMYEEYWKLTAAWTDIMGPKFNSSLRVVLDWNK